MKCKYTPPHQPQKCGLLKRPWNDPVAMMERSRRAYEEERVYIDALRAFAAQMAQEHHTGG